MTKKRPSTQKEHQNPQIDPKKIIYIGRKKDPPSEIAVVQEFKGKTVVSNGSGTTQTEFQETKYGVTPVV